MNIHKMSVEFDTVHMDKITRENLTLCKNEMWMLRQKPPQAQRWGKGEENETNWRQWGEIEKVKSRSGSLLFLPSPSVGKRDVFWV